MQGTRVDITRQPLGITFVLFVGLLVAFRSGAFLSLAPPASVPQAMPLGEVAERLAEGIPLLGEAAATLLLFLNAIILTRIITRNMMFVTRTYLPCIFYLIVSYGIQPPENSLAALIPAYLLLKGTEYLTEALGGKWRFDNVFRGALLTGAGFLFHAPAVTYLLIVPVAMVLFRRSRRETIVAFAGVLLPALTCGYVYWATGAGFAYPFIRLWHTLLSPSGTPLFGSGDGTAAYALCGLLGALLVLSVLSFFLSARDMRTRARKLHLYMLWLFVFVASALTLPCRSAGDLPTLAIPAGALLPAFFIRFPGGLPALLYLLILLCALASGLT